MFCVLDIESSGGAFGKESLIEIALFQYDGEEVVDQLISLVHTDQKIQPYVSKITGITNKMLTRAPRFHEIAKRIIQLTEGCILVGHNVQFDYRMLRQEFAHLGYKYERKTLDTIKLAEELIPGLPAYGLDKITKELGITNGNKHRAEGDARATLELFQLLQVKDRKKEIGILGQSISENNYTDDKVNDLLRSVKKNQGVYYLHNADGKLLYIGASANIKGSLSRLLIADNEKGKALRKEVHAVRTEITGNGLVSSIKKHEEVLEAKPLYNERQKSEQPYGIFIDEEKGKTFLVSRTLEEMGRKRPLCKVENRKKANRLIRMFKRNKSDRNKVISILKSLPDSAVFVGRGREVGERCAFVLQDKHFKGYFYFHLNQQLNSKTLLEHSASPVKNQKVALQWLKQSIMDGEVKLFEAGS